MDRRSLLLALACPSLSLASREGASDARLRLAYRRPEKNGWLYVHLQGTPAEIGYQHGALLAREIEDTQKVLHLSLTHASPYDWTFYRKAAQEVLWPHIEGEYREELQGIADGLRAHSVKLDAIDLTVMNAFMELSPYYTGWLEKQQNRQRTAPSAPEHCSAFVATGSYTRDGGPVIAHSNWSSYREGARWNIMFDVVPAQGRRFLMDGMPGLIHSGDDFGINDAGILITETTISQFNGFDPEGIPEFVRARKAMQYASSIDDFARIMKEGNNGGYANTWLVADRKTNEIARLELGLKHVTLDRTKDGYFVGTNFPLNPELIKDETDFTPGDTGNSPNARRNRAEKLLEENKGKVDLAFGKRYLSDHYDSFDKKDEPSERTLCGHIDLSTRGSKPWMPEYGTGGTVQAKVTDRALSEKMTLQAALGHPCGIHFRAAEHIKKHPEFAYERDVLKDIKSQPWTAFQAAK